MEQFNPEDHPHRRFNPLNGQWVLVSPHRAKRPWQGQVEKTAVDNRPEYDENCYLCPGNTRAGGLVNPKYTSTFVFNNDFAALQKDVPKGKWEKGGLLRAESETGICRVICFSPRHDLTLPEMSVEAIRSVVDLWAEQFSELAEMEGINYVQIFENKGEVMGCSNPHPHGQIWSQYSVPDEPAKETVRQEAYFNETGRTLLQDYLELELEEKSRIVVENEHFVAVVPFWATWPFETLVMSRQVHQDIRTFSDVEKTGLADIISQLTIRYDNLFNTSFPYSAGMHQQPTDGNEYPGWHWHMHFYPPLLRSATVKKFMVGYEMLANPQRDITAETSARMLRELPAEHYKAL